MTWRVEQVIGGPSALETLLNELSADGWSFFSIEINLVIAFKRR